jgi:uncharacterized membrane protein
MGLPVNMGAARDLLGGVVFFQVSAEVFWAYFAGAAIWLAGLAAIRTDVLLARGSDKLISMGRVFFALPMAVFGTEHFTAAKFVVQLVPKYMPWPWFWTFFVGAALIAASVSISLKREVWLSAPLLALMLFLFVTMISVPNILADPRNRVMWSTGLRDLSFSGGALALAGMQTEKWGSLARNIVINVGRLVIAVATLVFGVQQILRPDVAPGVPLDLQTPAGIPLRILWAYLAGAVFLVAGMCLLLNRKTRAAATALGAMVLLLVVFVYLPILVVRLKDIDNGLNYFVDTLAFSGAALLLADAMPKEEAPHV